MNRHDGANSCFSQLCEHAYTLTLTKVCIFFYPLCPIKLCLFHHVAKHFWYICLSGRAIAGLSYGQFKAIHHKFQCPTSIQGTVSDR